MTVSTDKVVSFHYTLRDPDGEQLESSVNSEPMAYLHGAGNIIAGLEQAMEGKAEGDTFETTVAPEDGYGIHREELIQRIPAKHLPNAARLQVGQVATLQTRSGPRQVRIVKKGRFMVDVDANHPMAGRTLVFEIEIVGIRDATPEEIAHRHVHGPGGHSHD